MSVPEDWREYELLDSGDGQKLEKWGEMVLVRPEPRAIWSKSNSSQWKEADGVYESDGWKFKTPPPVAWQIKYKNLVFAIKPTEFKHTGVFPEQAVNWDWLQKIITNYDSHGGQLPISNLKVLNLFAYTGGATMAAALAGAQVTHVDASRPAMMWASENAKLAEIPKERIRWIQEDALKFVQKEIRRGAKYDGIIMDPPRFGRGANGEVWKLDEDLPKLAHECGKILAEAPLFFLINAYTADLSHLAIKYVLEDVLKNKKVESGELGLPEAASGKILPAGIWARWNRN